MTRTRKRRRYPGCGLEPLVKWDGYESSKSPFRVFSRVQGLGGRVLAVLQLVRVAGFFFLEECGLREQQLE